MDDFNDYYKYVYGSKSSRITCQIRLSIDSFQGPIRLESSKNVNYIRFSEILSPGSFLSSQEGRQRKDYRLPQMLMVGVVFRPCYGEELSSTPDLDSRNTPDIPD